MNKANGKFKAGLIRMDNFGQIFQFISDAVIITDAVGKIIVLNQEATELTGYQCNELKGKQIIAVLKLFDLETERASAGLK